MAESIPDEITPLKGIREKDVPVAKINACLADIEPGCTNLSAFARLGGLFGYPLAAKAYEHAYSLTQHVNNYFRNNRHFERFNANQLGHVVFFVSRINRFEGEAPTAKEFAFLNELVTAMKKKIGQ